MFPGLPQLWKHRALGTAEFHMFPQFIMTLKAAQIQHNSSQIANDAWDVGMQQRWIQPVGFKREYG